MKNAVFIGEMEWGEVSEDRGSKHSPN